MQAIQKNKLNKGLLIAFEGIDGSGKSSVAQELARSLKQIGLPVLLTREPGGTPFGTAIRSLLHDRPYTLSAQTEFLLFAADRAQHIDDVIKPGLEQKYLIISDRMADSSYAYQGYGRGLSLDQLKHVNSWVLHGIKPDLVCYLKIDYQIAVDRMRKSRDKLTPFEQEKADFFKRVISGFDTVFENRAEVIEFDATKSVEQLTQETYDAVLALLDQSN